MDFLDYLYYKYYCWQIKVGNKDVASVFAIFAITFVFYLYIFAVLVFIGIILTEQQYENYNTLIKYSYFGTLIIVFISLCIKFYYKKHYKKILREKKYKNKSNFVAIMLPIVGFFLMILSIILMVMHEHREI
jgi:membrane protease YdiL (CAAX protease family)